MDTDQDINFYNDLHRLYEVSDSFPKGYTFRLQVEAGVLRNADAVQQWYRHLQCVYLSPSWEMFSNIPRNEAMRNFAAVLAKIYPEDMDGFFTEMHRCISVGKPFEDTFRYCSGNETYWAQVSMLSRLEGDLIVCDGFSLDVTDRKKTEYELQNEKLLIEALGNNLPSGSLFRCEVSVDELEQLADPMKIFDVLNMTYASKSWGKVSGVPRSDALHNLAEVMMKTHPDDQKILNPAVYRTLVSRQSLDIEVRYLVSETVMRWIRISFSARSEDATVVLEGVVIDVTDRKQVEDELQDEKRRMEALTNNLPDGSLHRLELDPATGVYRVAYLGANWERIAGGNHKAVMADVDKLFETIHPADRPRLKGMQEESARTMTDLHCEVRLSAPPPFRWIRIDAHPHREDELIVWDGITIDITGQKRVEENLIFEKNRLESLGNSLHCGCLVRCQIDAHEIGRMNEPDQLLGYLQMGYLSASWEKICNIPRAEVMYNIMPWLMKIHPDDRKTLVAALFRIILFRQTLDSEIRYNYSDTEPRWFRISMLARQEGGLIVCDGFIIDITARKTAEIEMAVYRDELEILVKQRTDELEVTNRELAGKNIQLNEEMTARNELMQQLKTGEEQMRNFINQSSEGILIFDHEGRITEWNHGMTKITGRSRKDVLGRFEWDVRWSFEPDEKRTFEALGDLHRKRLEFMHRDSPPETREMTLYADDGVVRYTRASMFQIKTADRKYFGRIVRDITHQRQADIELSRYRSNLEEMIREKTKELLASRERVISLSNNLPGGAIYQIQDRGNSEAAKITYASTGFTDMFGIAADDLMNDIALLFNLFHPEDGQRLATFFASAGSEGTHDAEIRVMRGNDTGWLHMRSTYRTGENGVRVWDGFLIDITEKKNAASQLEESYRRQDILTRILQIIQTAEDIPHAIRTVVTEIGKHMEVSRTYIFEKSSDGRTVDNTYEWCNEGIAPQMYYNRQIPVGAIDWFKVFEKGEFICTSDITTLSPKSCRMLSSQGVKSLMVIPLIDNGFVHGYMGLDDCNRHREYKGKDLELIQNLTQIITTAIRRHRAETATELSRRTMRKVLDSMYASVFTVDFDSKEVLFANKEAQEKWGHFEGQKCWKALNDAQTAACDFCPQSRLCDENGEPTGLYRREFWHEKTKRWFECVDAAVEWIDGRPVHMEYTIDITDRKNAENALVLEHNRLQAIGDHIPNGILFRFQIGARQLIDSNIRSFIRHMRLVYASASWEKLSNIPLDAAMQNIALPFTKIVPEDLSAIIPKIYRSLTRLSEFNAEVRYNRSDTEQLWIHIAAIPQIENDQIMTDGFVFDITERKKAEAELIRTKEKAEESDRLKSSFLANMSHEILTPINGIAGLLNVLSDDPQLSAGIREHIVDINSNSDRLIAMINDVLEASRLETGQMTVKSEPVCIDDLMEEIYNLLLQYLQVENKTRIVPEYVRNKAGGSVTVYTDPVRLRQIFFRLLNNAVKFTERGHIRIGWRMTDENRPEFFVEDTGIGIPESQLNVLFRPFRQLEEGYSRHYGGMGLGLSISHGLARLMGGDMSITSTEGKGSRFVFTVACNSTGGQ